MPMIVVVLGLPGSGKSYFAEQLAGRVGAVYLSSDQIRNSLGARGKYSEHDKMLIYNAMAEKTGQALNAGRDVVVDATFYQSVMIDLFVGLAKTHGTRIWFIRIDADESLIKLRLTEPRKVSEADYNVYLKIKEQFEGLQVPHITLKSESDNVNLMLAQAIDYIGVHE